MKNHPTSLLKFFLVHCSLTLMGGCLFSCSKPNDFNNFGVPKGFKLIDNRLTLSLMVEDPGIVTPIGIAIDKKDRVFVLESHTHLPLKDYFGPKGDLIKVFEDSNGDGTWDDVKVFAEGIQEGLNMAFSPEGILYVVTSREVLAFWDRDGDGVSEESKTILQLTEPQNVYAHAALLSITFSHDGWMYIGRGNTGGLAWALEGADGSVVSGYGDGGNIIRSRADGSQLEEFSTGFWNPFDLKFDSFGRLLVADNDPDSRGPNRLVHAVKDGDYGYKSLFGGSGMHPYLAWNGELPGTLPYAVALGEAPSGLLNANFAGLPLDYENQFLCTIWEESTIVRIWMQQEGLSLTGDSQVILEGGADFRPVAFATDSKGNIFFTDWVLREYPNHGKGKIWKLGTKKEVEIIQMDSSDLELQMVNTRPGHEEKNSGFESLIQNLKSEDPYEIHKAIMALSKGEFVKQLLAEVENSDPDIRLGILLALEKSGKKEVEFITKKFLNDPDPRIRNRSLIWIGSGQITERNGDLENALLTGETSIELFETYLETVKLLQPEFVSSYKIRKPDNSKSLKRTLPENFIASIVTDSQKPQKIRIFALRHLENLQTYQSQLLGFLKEEKELEIRLEIIQTIKKIQDKDIARELLQIALDAKNPEIIRSEAILALSGQSLEDVKVILPLLDDEDENIVLETVRYLRPWANDESVRKAFKDKISSEIPNALKQQLQLGIDRELTGRAAVSSPTEWNELLSGEGNLERGRRVFYSGSSLCSTCHTMDGRGGDLGPDLSNVGRSKSKSQLISSILIPSAETSPEWQGWFIKMNDGSIYQGRQIDVGFNDIKLYTQSEGFISLKKEDIMDYGILKQSLMPDGLEKRLSDQDLRDLLAFLMAE